MHIPITDSFGVWSLLITTELHNKWRRNSRSCTETDIQ